MRVIVASCIYESAVEKRTTSRGQLNKPLLERQLAVRVPAIRLNFVLARAQLPRRVLAERRRGATASVSDRTARTVIGEAGQGRTAVTGTVDAVGAGNKRSTSTPRPKGIPARLDRGRSRNRPSTACVLPQRDFQ
jgi:hypothetical protein